MGIEISPTWTFKEIVSNIKTIKLQYEEILSSFSMFTIKEMNVYKKSVRDSIYALDLPEWKKDRIWEYMNGCEILDVLIKISEREENGTRTKRKAKNIN